MPAKAFACICVTIFYTLYGRGLPAQGGGGCLLVCFCCFTSQVNSYGHCGTVSSPNHTFSWAGLNKRLTSNCAHTFACNWQQPFLNESAEGRRMTVEIISWSISTKVWYRAGIELATPGIAVRHASVARHVTDCVTRPGNKGGGGGVQQPKNPGPKAINCLFYQIRN